MAKSLFDQTVTVQSQYPTNDATVAALAGVVAAADSTLIDALARENVSVVVVIYTQDIPPVAVGDSLIIGTMSYPVVAPTRPYVSAAMGMSLYVTPCGAGTPT